MNYQRKTGIIFIKATSGQTQGVFDRIRDIDWVIGAWAVTGEYDLIVWVNAESDEQLFTFASSLRSAEGVEYTNSHFVRSGQVQSWESLSNPNGAWVRLRATSADDVPARLAELAFVGAWVNIPGDYDFLIWTYGDTTRETLEHVLSFSGKPGWRSITQIPVFSFLNGSFNEQA